jgi:hypothetical protein
MCMLRRIATVAPTYHDISIVQYYLLLLPQPNGQVLLGEVTAGTCAFTQGNSIYWQPLHYTARAGARLEIDHRGSSFSVYESENSRVWTSAAELSSGLHMSAPHSFYSASGAYELRVQTDGNLVVYETASSSAVWSSGTHSDTVPTLHMTVCVLIPLHKHMHTVYAAARAEIAYTLLLMC